MNYYERFREIVGEFTGYYISISDIKSIVENHPYFAAPGDLNKIWMNVDQFGLCSFPRLIEAMIKWPNQNFNSVRYSQCNCKKVLIDEIAPFLNWTDEILVCGSWHGVMAMMLEYQGWTNITCIDTDIEACEVAKYLLDETGSPIKVMPYDMFNVNYDNYKAIINTSCEHIDLIEWLRILPSGKMVGLQSTNLPYHNHVNIVESADQFKYFTHEFISPVALKETEFTGPLPEMNKHIRYTMIGAT